MKKAPQSSDVKGIGHRATINRDAAGVPTIIGERRADVCYGIGYAHARDRLVQMMLVRAIAHGRASEFFSGDETLIDIDTYMRRIALHRNCDREIGRLPAARQEEINAYCQGVNDAMVRHRRPLEFMITGHHPAPWTAEDSLVTARLMGFLGLAQAQAIAEKFILQMIRKDVPPAHVRALFPYLTDVIDVSLLKAIHLQEGVVPDALWSIGLPIMKASNNWVVSGAKSASGSPILATDPHLEINRLPAIWYEAVMQYQQQFVSGITLPGLPMVVMGRSAHLAWGGTYAFVDMIDYFIEDCRDGAYRRDNQWYPFTQRKEILRPRGKPEIELIFHENHHGVLEGDPHVTGKHLAMAFSAQDDAGAEIFNRMMTIDRFESVEEARDEIRHVKMPCMNWVLADNHGNIGYQMNGAMPQRAAGYSGLLPIPGWDAANDWQGRVDPQLLPGLTNPPQGWFATANNDLNHLGKAAPITLAMADYRVQRIGDLLSREGKMIAADMKIMQYDVYSLQAAQMMPLLLPHLPPDHPNTALLKQWNFQYSDDSRAATLFEAIYRELLCVIFGDHGMGRPAIEFLMDNSGIITEFYGNFDRVIFDEQSVWFAGRDRSAMIRSAIEAAIDTAPRPYDETRKFDMNNLFFGGKLPSYLGFDIKDRSLPGGRATILQGQMFTFGSRKSSFSPSWRMVCDLSGDHIECNLPGGPSGSRYSRYYKNDLENWANGVYKRLRPTPRK